LKQLEVKGGEQIPTLQEVIEILLDYSELIINIEIKPPSIEKRVLEIIELNEIESQVILSSYLYSVLKAVRQYNKQIQTALVYEYHLENPVQLAQQLEVMALHPELPFISERLIERAHREEILVNPWAVNDEAEMRRMIVMEVDGIITDFPERLLRILNSS
jgi:glycerophosphoryl diester phosphodiesterase